MLENQLRKSVLPLGALMTAGALVLSTAPDATAVVAHSTSDPTASDAAASEDPIPGDVSASATETDTEQASQTEKVTVVATRKLTSKVKASGRASVKATRSAKATSTVTVVRYAATTAEAEAAAKAAADQAAKDAAKKAAKARAAKLATSAAKAGAKGKARHRADVNAHKRFVSLVLHGAKAQKGKPYRWGANGPRAFDCSGFVRYVMRGVGIKGLPRTSSSIAGHTHRVAKAHKKPGDLIFFTSGSHVYHVAIYAGHGQIWHAPGSGKHVQKIKIWTSSYLVGRVLA